MTDLLNSNTNLLIKMALPLGISFFGVLFLSLVFGKLLLLLKLPKKIAQPIVSLAAVFLFLYVVVYLGDKFSRGL